MRLRAFSIFLVILSFSLSMHRYVFADPSETQGITKNEILIGSVCALGGHASFLGTQLTQGANAYIDVINRQGGIHGRKIRLLTYDDQYDPALTLPLTEKLINQDGVFVLFNYVGTPTSKVIVKPVNQYRIPLLGLFTGAEFLRNPFQPYIFNVRASYFKETETITDFWLQRGRKKIAVLMQNDAFGKAVLEGVRIALARHILSPVDVATFERGQNPDDAAIEKLKAAKPDAIVMVGTYTPLAYFVNKAKKAGMNDVEFHTVSFVGPGAFAKQLLDYGETTAKNVFVTQVVPSPFHSENPAAREFLKIYQSAYPNDTPNYVAMEGFINAKILVETLRRSGKHPTRSKFIKTLTKMSDYDAGTGLPVSIGPRNHNFFERVFLSVVREGRFEIQE